jgi:SPP1 gp7 family putative phage head morphogenesis protein
LAGALNDSRGRTPPFYRNGSSSSTFELRRVQIAGNDDRSGNEGERQLRRAEARLGIRRDAAQTLANLGFISLTPVAGGKDEITEPFRDSWVVYACVRAWKRALRGIPMVLRRGQDPDSPTVGPGDQLFDLLSRPNPRRGLTWPAMVEQDMTNLLLTGESFWFLADAIGRPVVPAKDYDSDQSRLIPLPIQIVPVIGSMTQIELRPADGLPWAYSFARSGSAERIKFAPSSVVAHVEYDPYNAFRGIGPAEIAARAASVGFQAERYSEAVMRSGGPGAFLVYRQEELSPETESQLQEKIDEAIHAPDRTGGLQVLTGDVDVVPNPATPKEMLTREALTESRDAICTVMGVPPPVIGIYDRATYNNISEAYRQFYTNVRATLDVYAETINILFIQRLEDYRLAEYRVSFDYSTVNYLRESEDDKIKLSADVAAKRVGLSFNDVARLAGVRGELPASGEEVAKADTEQVIDVDSEDEERALSSQAAREAYVEQYHARVTAPFERELGLGVMGWLRGYERAVIRRVRRFAEIGPHEDEKTALSETRDRPNVTRELLTVEQIDELLGANHRKWAQLLEAAASSALDGVYAAALADMAAELAVIQIPMTSPLVQSFLATQKIRLAEGVESTIAARVRGALLEVLSEASTGTDLQAAVREVLPELTDELRRVFGSKEARAATIARTEVSKAASNARARQMTEANVGAIEWLTMRDGHVRPAHIALDGQIRANGQEFLPGLRWPHDENCQDASLVVNCRCIPLPVLSTTP